MPTISQTTANVLETNYVVYNGKEYQVKTAYALITASTNAQVVAAVSGKQICCIGYIVNNPTGNSTYKFTSFNGVATHTDLTLTFDTVSNVLHRSTQDLVQFIGVVSEAIHLFAGANNISTQVWYIEV